jgi:4'-phosphopantetheinyl transferase
VLEIRNINAKITLGLLDLAAFSTAAGIDVKRESEKAGALYVLKHLLNNEPFELGYSATNKPFLKNRAEHISISHSHNRLAIICNTTHNTGIDVELVRDKVKNIQHKFLNAQEIAFANEDPETLITLWAAKETLYKVYGLKEVDFKKHLFVDAFLNGDTITGRIKMAHLNKTYLLANERLEDYKLVYALDEV